MDIAISELIPYVYTEKGLMNTEFILSVNEQRKMQNVLYKSPLKATLELTDKCNQRCIHCYNDSGMRESYDMPMEKWIDVCHQLGKMKVFSCILSGGEPMLLGDKLYELLDILNQYGVSIGMNTNGLLLNERVMNTLTKYNFEWIQISMDGAKEYTHNYIRGCNCWEKTLQAAKLVREFGIPLVISFVINSFNYREIEDAIDLSYYFGAKKIVFTIFESLGRAKENKYQLDINNEIRIHIYKSIKRKHKQYSGCMGVQIIPESILAQELQINMGNDTVLIRPDGNVKFSCFMPFVIGNIQMEKLESIWERKGKSVWYNKTVLKYINDYKNYIISNFYGNNKDAEEIKTEIFL